MNSTNQTDCQDRPGEAFSLKYSGERREIGGVEWASLVMDVMNEVAQIFKPLTADLLLYCYYKDTGFEDWDVEPNTPAFFLRESNIPENVYAAPGFNQKIAPTVVSQVPQINKESVVSWVENALNQESPRPDMDIVDVDRLNFRTVRARIRNEKPFLGRDTLNVDHFRMGKYKYPLRSIEGKLWAYSPLIETYTKPSFYVRTERYMGTLDLDIYWNWWTSTSSEDKDALEQALLNLIDKGQWKLSFMVKHLDMPKLKDLAEELK